MAADDIYTTLLGESEPTPNDSETPVADAIGQDIRQAARDTQIASEYIDLLGETDYGPPNVVFGTGDYFEKGLEAGVEQVVGSVYGMGAIGNLILGNEEAAETNLNEMERRDQNLQAILAPLDDFPDFLENPSFEDALNQAARGVGQFVAPAALTIGGAFAGGITTGIANTAFTSAGRAALRDTLSSVTRKFATFGRGRQVKDLPAIPPDPTIPLLTGPGNIYKELWYKNLRNKGVDNLTAAEKVTMSGAHNFLRDVKAGAAAGAFASSEVMIAPEVLREYQEAGLPLGADEALAALVVGAPAAAVDVLGEAVFFGSLFKVAHGKTRLARTRRRAALGYPLSEQDKKVLALSALAEAKGLKSIGEVGKRYLRKYENPSRLALLGDITRAALASAGVEGGTEALQEEIIMSQATLFNTDFDNQGVEANLRRGQAFFDGFVAGGARGAIGGVSAGIFKQARDFYNQTKDDALFGFVQRKTVRDVEKLGGLPEVKEDIQAQLGTLVNPKHKRTSLWLSEENLKSLELIDKDRKLIDILNEGTIDLTKIQDFLRESYAKLGIPESNVPAISVTLDKDGYGVLLSVDPSVIKKFNKERMDGRSLRDVLQEILDFTETPTSSNGDEVVVSLLENDRVVWEQTVPNEESAIEEVVEKADSQVQGGVLKPEDQLELDFGNPGEAVSVEPISNEEIVNKAKTETSEPEEDFSNLTDEELEETILDSLEEDNETRTDKLLAEHAKRKGEPKREIIIQTVEDVAEYRLDNNPETDDDDPIIKKMSEELGDTPEGVNAILNDYVTEAVEEGIVDVDGGRGYEVAGTDQAIDAEIIEDATNITQVGNETLLGGKYAAAFKKANIENIPEEGLAEIRRLQSEIMSLTVAAELAYSSVFKSSDATKEMERINGLLAEKNEAYQDILNKLETYEQNETSQLLNNLITKVIKENPNKKNVPTAAFNKALNALPPKDVALIRINQKTKKRLKGRLAAIANETAELVAINKENREQAELATTPEKPTQTQVEQLFLNELGAGPTETQELIKGTSADYLRRVRELLDEQEIRISSGDNQVILTRDILDQLRSAVLAEERELQPIFLDKADQEVKRAIDRIDRKTKGQRTFTDASLEDIKDQKEKQALKEARQQAIEKVVAKADLFGVPLRSFGINGGPTISSHLADYMDGAEISLIDPELIQANASILRNLLEAQRADPSSIFKLKTTDIIFGEKSDQTIFDPSANPQKIKSDLFRSDADLANKLQKKGYTVNMVGDMIDALFGIVKLQGGKNMVAPVIGLQNRFGKAQTRRLIKFVEDVGDLLGLRVEKNYQVIIKETTPESLPELYNDSFRGMTPIEAVQSAVTQAMQTAQNNNKNNPLNFKDAEKYSGDDGSMRFMWIKKTTDSENVLSFNEVLKAGVAIFDSGLDSLERANLSYGYKVAMGYAKLLSNKFLTEFKDKNGKPAEIIFRYSFKDGKTYKTHDIPLKTMMQDTVIPAGLVKKSEKLPFFNSSVINKMENGVYINDLDAIIKGLKTKDGFEDPISVRSKLETKPDLFSLPIYYNRTTGKFQSARELAESITETPFYKENKLTKPSLVSAILTLEQQILNPTFETAKDKIRGIEESFTSLEELKQEVIDRHRANYRLHGYDEDFLSSIAPLGELDLDRLQLTEITSGLQDGVDYWGYKLGSKLGYKVLGLAASEQVGFGDEARVIPKTEFGKQILLLEDEAKTNPAQFKDLAEAEVELINLISGETERRGVTAGSLDEPLSYARRTELVVRYSDGVVIFSQTEPGTNKVNTPGSALTIRLAEQFDKPVLINPKSKEEILSFLMRHNIKRLNIAGAGASEPAYFANNPDYRSIIEGALEDVKDLTSGDAKSELRKQALANPEIYRFPTLEEQYAHLQAIAQENNILTENDYAKLADDSDDISRAEFSEAINDPDGYSSTFKDDQYEAPYFTKKAAAPYRQLSQNINGAVSGKVRDTETPGVYIADDVSDTFNIASLTGETRETINKLLVLRSRDKDPKDTLSADERAALRELEKNADNLFKGPDLNSVYQTRRNIAQDLNLDLGKTTYTNTFKEISELAANILKLNKKRKIFVMYENNPIVFEDNQINKVIHRMIHGKKDTLKSFVEDIGNPERIVTSYKGIDLVILKNPEIYKATLDQEIAKRGLTSEITLQEVEGVILSSYFHSFGHIFFDEYMKGKLDINSGVGKLLLEEFEKAKANPKAPAQYKQKGGFEEFVSDQAGRGALDKMARFDRRNKAIKEADKTMHPRTKAFTTNLQKTLRKYYNTTKVKFAQDILGRAAGDPGDAIILFLNETSKTKNPENYRGGLAEIAKRRLDFKKDVKKMSSDAFEKAYKDIEQQDVKKLIEDSADFLKKLVFSSIDYLNTQNVNPAFTRMLYRQTQQKGDLGFVQEKDDLFNQIINELIEPLAKAKGLTIGGFFDDNEIGEAARAEINESLKRFSNHIVSFGDKEFLKQLRDPNYVGPDNRRIPEESLLIYDVINRRLGKLMSQADIAKMPNFDLSRNLDIEKLSFDESVRNKVILLIVHHNKDKKISRARAEREVDDIIAQGESDLYVNKDAEELHEMVASVAVGASPERSKLFRKIPTADLERAGALRDRLTSQIHSIRSLTSKIVYNRKVVNVISDDEILRARELMQQKQFTTPSGVVEDMSFLAYFGALDTRAEQKAKVKKSGGELSFDENIYNVRGWKAAVSFIWLDPKVKDPIIATQAAEAILGRAGMAINKLPNFRNLQSGLALLNQVTFLTFSALSTIPEFAGPMVQRGDLEGVAMTFRATMKNFKNTEEANNMLRAVGLMGISQSVEASIYAGDLGWATNTTQNLSKFFFKSIFITKMMNFLSRNSGIVAYMAIESDAKRGLQGDAQAIERLALLNLTPEEATYALNKVNFLDESNPKTMSEYSKLFRTDNRTVKLRQGISILSKEMMLKPNSAQRTIWMNNPFFALLSQLKPFYYSYGKVFISNVINNVRRQYKYNGPIASIIPLIILIGMMLPLAALGLELRELVKYVLKGGDPEVFRSDDMTMPSYLVELIDRSGITGQAGLLIPTFEAELYGDAFFTPLLGPTAERGFDIIEGEGNVWDYVPWLGAVGYDN